MIAVPLHESCGETGAICTADGRVLSNASSRTIPGPLSVSVADAHAEEGVDQALRFLVTLSRAVDRTVTVDYQTVDGTAHAGSDYEAASGTLDFEPGETERVVIVAALDDAVDEGEGNIRPGAAKPIRRTDRSRASDRHDREHRSRSRQNGLRGSGAPWRTRWWTPLAADSTAPPEPTSPSRVTSSGPGVQRTARRPLGPTPKAPPSSIRCRGKTPCFEARSSSPPHRGTEQNRCGPHGAASRESSFASNDDELVALKGDVTSTLLGLDAEAGDWLAGAALAHNRGDGSYTHTSANRGEVSSTLTSVHPYVRKRIGDDVMLWGIGRIRHRHADARRPVP